MIAYGRNKVKYSLENRAIRSEAGCQDFHVKGREETLLARIYDRGLRGREREEEVRMAMEGGGSSLLQSPVDILYVGGRFAGFLYYDYSAEQPVFQDEPDMAGPASEEREGRRSSRASGNVPLAVIPAVETVLLALLTKFIIYPFYVGLVYRNAGISYTLSLMVGGWVPAVAGFLALILAFQAVKGTENAAAVAVGCALAYLAGAAGLLALATLVTAVLNAAVSLFVAALPTIIGAVIVIYIIKVFLGDKG